MIQDIALYADPWSCESYDLASQDKLADLPLWQELAERSGGPVLELACGSGRILFPLAREGHRVTGLDISPEMLNLARARFTCESPHVQARVELVAAGMTDFDLGRQFGLIYSAGRAFLALRTRDDQRACLRHCAQHLRPGGLLAFDLFNTRLDFLLRPGGVDDTPREHFGPNAERVIEAGHADFDLTTQSLHYRLRSEATTAAGEPHLRQHACDLHYYFRFEVEWMLEACGFAVEAVYGGFDKSEFTSESRAMVFVARRA